VTIRLKDVRFTYAAGTRWARPVLKGVNLEARPGKCLGILGGNGSGKTTLIRHMNGLLLPESGEVLVGDLALRPGVKRPPRLSGEVGLVFQFPEKQLFAETVLDDVALGLEFAGSYGPVTLRSEFYRADWGRSEGSDPSFDGWYGEASWFLTGEMANYRQGKFIRPDIRRDSGAWELGVRYSTIDLNDEEVEGGTEDNWSFGLNWYSRIHWRFMGNVIKVDADGPKGEEDPWIVQFRAQYFF